MTETLIFGWSGGKDSALAVYELSKDKNFQIAALLTTVTEGYDRISMHGVRRDLLRKQAAAPGYAVVVRQPGAPLQRYDVHSMRFEGRHCTDPIGSRIELTEGFAGK
jgi:diphthamide synthase (EF-2-diphthine--ammonia ligase)